MIVHRFDVLESTNLHLMNMAREGAPAWTVVLADSQTGGLGRSGRFWWSPPGGLYMSVLLRPAMRAGNLPRIPILASLALLQAFGGSRSPVRVKWPNDILFSERKLAGILVKSRTEGAAVSWVVTGIGINLVRPDEDAPEEIREKVAFLEDIPLNMERDDLAEAILEGFRGSVDCLGDDGAWEEAMSRWTLSAAWDKPCLYRDGTREITGMPVRLAGDGGLVLRTERGEITVHSGEITETVQSPKPEGQS